jgi:hypothetical protein
VPFNIESSVLKRYSADIDQVHSYLTSNGFSLTSRVAGGRVRYYESSGFNITVVQGPFGTVIFPSGPIRGRVFGETAVSVGRGLDERLADSVPEQTDGEESSGNRGSTADDQVMV